MAHQRGLLEKMMPALSFPRWIKWEKGHVRMSQCGEKPGVYKNHDREVWLVVRVWEVGWVGRGARLDLGEPCPMCPRFLSLPSGGPEPEKDVKQGWEATIIRLALKSRFGGRELGTGEL